MLDYEKSGDDLGLRSERAQMKWAYLMSITDGKAAGGGLARRHFRDSPRQPDDAIDDVLSELDDVTGANWDRIWKSGA
ncbi:hypothetical protein FNJ84_05215 [Paracoccus sp. M683]|nr:hypothetical protein FNJ84_05215 [Paracoccus sp. M683]